MKPHREKVVVKTSLISNCANLLLVGFKAIVGFLSNFHRNYLSPIPSITSAMPCLVSSQSSAPNLPVKLPNASTRTNAYEKENNHYS